MLDFIKQKQIFFLVGLQLITLLISESKLYALNYTYYDFGLYLNRIYNIYNYNLLLFDGHFQPVDILLSNLWLFDQSVVPYLLVFIKQLFVFITFLILYKAVGKVSGILFLVFPTTWYVLLNDFHVDCLILPFFALLIYSIKERKFYSGIFISLFFLFIKEPYAIITASFGVVLIYFGAISKANRKYIIPGIVVILISIGYLMWALDAISKYSQFPELIAYKSSAFSWLGTSLVEVLSNFIKNPFMVIGTVFGNNNKILLLVYLFLPFIFALYKSPWIIFLIMPMLAVSLLSALPNYYSITSHYMIPFVVPLVASYDISFKKLNSAILYYSVSLLIVFNVCLSPSPISIWFLTKDKWNYTWEAYIPTQRDSKIKKLIDDVIPIDPNYNVWTQNSLVTARLVARKSSGVYTNIQMQTSKNTLPDFILHDTKRKFYVGDVLCSESNCSGYKNLNVLLSSSYIAKVYYDGFTIFEKK